jgi:hypothetical protein
VQTLRDFEGAKIGPKSQIRNEWVSGIALYWVHDSVVGNDHGTNTIAIDIDQFASPADAEELQATYEADFRSEIQKLPALRNSEVPLPLPGIPGAFTTENAIGSGSVFSVEYHKASYLVTIMADNSAVPPLTAATVQQIAQEQFKRIPA